MHRHPFRLVRLVLILGLAAVPGRAQDPVPLEDLAKQQLKGTVKADEFESRALGRKARFNVYLPPGYGDDTGRRYPLLLFLHGLFEDRNRWITRAGPQIVEAEIVEGRMPATVVAVPEGGTGLWIDARTGRSRYRTFLVEDFLPHLDKNFRLDASRRHRWIAGVSAGGSGALALAFSRPDLFGAVAAHDPMILADAAAKVAEDHPVVSHIFIRRPLREAFGDPIDSGWWDRHHPCALARGLDPENAPAIRIDIATGSSLGFQAGAGRLHRILEERRLQHVYAEHPGDLGWEHLREYLPASLRFFTENAGAAPIPPPGANKDG